MGRFITEDYINEFSLPGWKQYKKGIEQFKNHTSIENNIKQLRDKIASMSDGPAKDASKAELDKLVKNSQETLSNSDGDRLMGAIKMGATGVGATAGGGALYYGINKFKNRNK